MTKKGVVLTMLKELRKRDIVVSYDVAMLMFNLILEIIKNETSKGSKVVLENFGTFRPKVLSSGGAGAFWNVSLKRSRDWRSRCVIVKGESLMEKYGYEKERKDPTVKTAAEKGRCPKCGAELWGNPPICPTHGSEPFERRPDGETEKG